jgi:hypothetical protein
LQQAEKSLDVQCPFGKSRGSVQRIFLAFSGDRCQEHNMNVKGPPFLTPMPPAAQRLGETFDEFEAGLARSVADGSRLAQLLLQLLAMLREALARFALGVSADTAMAAVPEAAVACVADRSRLIGARRVRVACARPAARGVVAADGLASVVVPVAPTIRAHDWFIAQWVRIERVGFSNSDYMDA